MNDASSGVSKQNKSSDILEEIKLMTSQNSTNNSLERNDIKNQNLNSKKEINKNKFITKKTKQDEYNKKIRQYIEFHQKYSNTNKSNNMKDKNRENNLLFHNQNSMQADNNEDNYFKNNFIKNGKYSNMKNYVSPSFDYNVKNNHKNNNIKLNFKNKNSNPIKLQSNELKGVHKNKKQNNSNTSVDLRESRSSLNGFDFLLEKMKKSNNINRKNLKNNNHTNNYNTNYNPEIKKYLTSTPITGRKTSFIKNKISQSNDFEDKRRKEEIKMIFEREFKQKMLSKKTKNKKSNKNSLFNGFSRNNKKENNKILISSYSQKNINKNKIQKYYFQTINTKERNSYTNIDNKSNLTYDKYHSILKEKIIQLNQEITNLKNEEKQLLEQLINYKENEKLCNDIRDIREEIKKYKIIIEKSTNACEEYSLEIQKIKNILGGDDSEGNKGEDEDKDYLEYNNNINNNE